MACEDDDNAKRGENAGVKVLVSANGGATIMLIQDVSADLCEGLRKPLKCNKLNIVHCPIEQLKVSCAMSSDN